MMVWKNFPLPPLHGVLLGLYPPVACTSSKSTVCSIIGGAGQFHWSSDLYLRLYPHFTSEDRSDLYAPTFGALRKSWRFIHRFESRRVHLRSNLTEREGLILLIRAYFKWILPEHSKFFEPVPLFSSSPSTSRSLKCACSRRLDLRRQRISRKPRGLYASVLQKRRKWFQLRGRAIMPPDLEESEDDMAETELEEQDAYWRYDEEEEQRLRRQFGLSISCRGAATEYSDEKNSAALKEELQAEEDGAVNADGQDDGCLEEELENDIVLRSLWPPPHHDLEKETLKRSGKRRWVEDKADEGIRRKRRRVAYR
ncbi:hypothetical protein BT69DRAFT_433381 [Atractiella rhizophila]|nr:hypothetical protein BT69DRAFT_433381 [Atractiella rhizophila]